MKDAAAYSACVVIPPEMREAEVTIPGVQLWHYITDDQLNTLGDMRREPVMEIFLAALGVFFGSLIPTIEALARFKSSSNPMGIEDLITALLCVFAGGVLCVTGFLWKQRLKGHRGLVETIQSRKRVPVQGE